MGSTPDAQKPPVTPVDQQILGTLRQLYLVTLTSWVIIALILMGFFGYIQLQRLTILEQTTNGILSVLKNSPRTPQNIQINP